MNKGAGLYFHPMGDKHIEGFGKKGKTIEIVASNPLSEDAILYFILDKFGKDLPKDTIKFLNSLRETKTKTVTEIIKEKVTETVVDAETGEEKTVTKMVPKKVTKEVKYSYTKLLDSIGADEKLLETIDAMLLKKDSYSLIIGEDCITHPHSANIAKLAGMVERYTDFKVVVAPTQTNSLGVSLICDLDSDISGKTVGYNMKADYQLSGLGDGDIDMPTMNQQEGTFTNINKKVVPTNAAIIYNGFELNDIANAILDDKKINTIDYTSEIFKKVAFDDLDNYFSNDWKEHRGYELDINETKPENLKTVLDKKSIKLKKDEYIIYNGNPINQFNEFTAVATQLKDDIVALYLSETLKKKLDLDDKVEIKANDKTIVLDVRVDKNLIGDISYVPTFDKTIDTKSLFDTTRFSVANLKRV
jgi:NADH-quinone oxidoreductase subunit G